MKKALAHHYKTLLLSHATPSEVAWGFAIGIFVAMTPTIPFHMAIAVALSLFFKKNKISAILGCWVSNPLTFFPLYYFCYQVGEWLIHDPRPKHLRPESFKDFIHLGKEMMIPLWLGGLTVGLVSAIVSYYVVKNIYPVFQKKMHEKFAREGRG